MTGEEGLVVAAKAAEETAEAVMAAAAMAAAGTEVGERVAAGSRPHI